MRVGAWILALLLCGCASLNEGPTYEKAANSKLIQVDYAAADAILAQGRGALDAEKPILAATLVNIDDLQQSSRLGRLISEHPASRLAQQGMTVIEMKMRGNIFMQRDVGEMLLSREVREITSAHNAQAVVVGTYAASTEYAYITVKLVRSADNEIIGAYNYAVPLDSNVKGLLAQTN
jgi:TolB-like protein